MINSVTAWVMARDIMIDFLSAYHGICIGVQYDELVCDKLFIDKYDVPVDI